MTTVAVLADPPVEGETFTSLVPDTLSPREAVQLYEALLADVCETVQHGEGELLVNYRPAEKTGVDNPERVLREVLDDELPEPGAARYEPQVGESYAGRVGNTLTHLIEEEGEQTVAVLEPTAAFFRREHLGTAMMKLRSSNVVLGPTPAGDVYFAGFTDSIDFTDIYETPALETFTDRAVAAGYAVDFLPITPTVTDDETIRMAVTQIRSRLAAERLVPPRTAARITEWGLRVDETGSLIRE